MKDTIGGAGVSTETRMRGLVASAFFSVVLIVAMLMLGLPSELVGQQAWPG